MESILHREPDVLYRLFRNSISTESHHVINVMLWIHAIIPSYVERLTC